MEEGRNRKATGQNPCLPARSASKGKSFPCWRCGLASKLTPAVRQTHRLTSSPRHAQPITNAVNRTKPPETRLPPECRGRQETSDSDSPQAAGIADSGRRCRDRLRPPYHHAPDPQRRSVPAADPPPLLLLVSTRRAAALPPREDCR